MLLLDLPMTGYAQSLAIQRQLVESRLSDHTRPDCLILVEHPPTVTLGVRARSSDLLISENEIKRKGVEVHEVDRGGEATYHGPGQLVCYPILDLRDRGMSVREYVSRLEETIIRTVHHFRVQAYRVPRRPGVWAGPAEKVASIGVKVRNRVTYHGFSLNVSLTMDPCDLIVSCGTPGTRMVSLSQLADAPVSMSAAREAVAGSFSLVFDVELRRCPLEDVLKRPE